MTYFSKHIPSYKMNKKHVFLKIKCLQPFTLQQYMTQMATYAKFILISILITGNHNYMLHELVNIQNTHSDMITHEYTHIHVQTHVSMNTCTCIYMHPSNHKDNKNINHDPKIYKTKVNVKCEILIHKIEYFLYLQFACTSKQS